MEKICHDNILSIFEFLPNNFSTLSFIKSCKYINQIGKRYGYLKDINNKRVSYSFFISQYQLHYRFLRCMEINNVENPHLGLTEYYPNVVFLTNNIISDCIDPMVICYKTTSLYITENHSRRNILHINWDKFPNLRCVNIRSSFKVCLIGIQNCKQLRRVIILSKLPSQFPDEIKDLQNVEIIITNSIVKQNLKFKSRNLTTFVTGSSISYTTDFFKDIVLGTDIYQPYHNYSLMW